MPLPYDPEKVTYFAETDARNKRLKFGIKAKDRTRHMYVIGKTGMGKSTLLENMAVQDIQNGEGMAFIDPHGKTADLLLDYVPEHRLKDVLYFAPFDMEYPVSFNVMEDVGPDKRHLVANGLMSAFKKIWVDAWSARMEYILNNILLALLEYPDSTLIGVNRMLADKEYRNKVVANVSDTSVKAFWVDEFAKYSDKFMTEAGAAIQNKIGQFISNPLVRNIIGQPKSTFDIREMMDSRKIIIINLSKGRVGESNANLLGSMLITKIYLGAMSRADVPDSVLTRLPNFYLYVDEFQSFANESFADILSEARKYKLNLTMAHQYIEQMSEEVRAAVFGNVGTMGIFRVGAYDAEVLEKEFAPQFTAEDIVNLGFAQVYLKLMIDGVTSHPFSATTLPPIVKPLASLKEMIIGESRKTFARPRSVVEQDINDWHKPVGNPRTERGDRPGAPSAERPRPPREFLPREASFREAPREVSRESTPREFALPRESTPRETTPKEKVFQKAFERAQTEVARPPVPQSSEKPPVISLESLKQAPKPEKKPSEKNLSSLREALAALKKNQEKETVPEVAPAPIQPKKTEPVEPKAFSQNIVEKLPIPPAQKKPEEKPQSIARPAEIPEDVLRKVLEVKRPNEK